MANTIKDPRVRRWATIGLLLVCAVVLGRLVLSIADVTGGPGTTSASLAPHASGAARPSPPETQAPPATGASAATLNLHELAQLNGRPLPDFERNPFQYGPTPEQIQAQEHAAEIAKNPPPPVAPPPPPVPFRAIGYQQAANGQRVAYLCVSGGGAAPGAGATGAAGTCAEDQEPYAVREGQEFGQHFKVLRITDSMVEVQDESYHQTVQLPFPQ
ncbi:MAG TPA: hypothetical protein VGZ29_09595 [Terriglobia bacterium]|nr:hypothetical protein [Terriglobia bacterium]